MEAEPKGLSQPQEERQVGMVTSVPETTSTHLEQKLLVC